MEDVTKFVPRTHTLVTIRFHCGLLCCVVLCCVVLCCVVLCCVVLCCVVLCCVVLCCVFFRHWWHKRVTFVCSGSQWNLGTLSLNKLMTWKLAHHCLNVHILLILRHLKRKCLQIRQQCKIRCVTFLVTRKDVVDSCVGGLLSQDVLSSVQFTVHSWEALQGNLSFISRTSRL